MTISVGDFCSNVYFGDYAQEVLAIRKETDKITRDKKKATLPAATISGRFSERSLTRLIEHSGFISVDIDVKDNLFIKNWKEVRDDLSQYVNVFFSALSVSGKGAFLVIPIENPAKHEAHFDSLKRDFIALGYSIDKSCRDVSRLRGISYDPEAKINYNAIPYQKVFKWPISRSNIRPCKSNTDDLDVLIDKILRSGLDITNGYENWFEIGRAIANEYSESGRLIFHQLSQIYKGYNPHETNKQYNACLRSPGRATKATIFHFAKEQGILLH